MNARRRIAIALAVALTALCASALAAGAGAKGNRALPKKPQPGAEFLEGKPLTEVTFRWSIPEGGVAKRIQVSGGDDTLEDGSFAKTIHSKNLKDDEKKIKLGIAAPGRYYWHVQAENSEGKKEYGPTSGFVVLATLSRGEAVDYTQAVIKSRLEGKFNVRKLDCDRLTKLASRCKFSGNAQGFSFNGSGKTFLKGEAPDNFKFYHYKYVVDFVNQECLQDTNGKRDKCTDRIRWTA